MTKTYTPVVDAGELVEQGMSDGRRRPLQLGLYIREHLRITRTDYQYRIWKCWCATCEQKGYKIPEYQSFRKYFHNLKSLGLVKKVHKEGADHFARSYYAVNRRDSEAWRNPTAFLSDQRKGRR